MPIRSRQQMVDDLEGEQSLKLLYARPIARNSGLRGISATKGLRDGKTGRVLINGAGGSEYSSVNIGLGSKPQGDRIPSVVQDAGNTWIDY